MNQNYHGTDHCKRFSMSTRTEVPTPAETPTFLYTVHFVGPRGCGHWLFVIEEF